MISYFIDSSQYTVSQNLFLRFLGLTYFFAFASLFSQAKGLLGSYGILPVKDYLRVIPSLTLFRFKNDDFFIKALAGTGVALAILLSAGFSPLIDLILLWVIYASFMAVGQDFMSFQWDVMLLEIGGMAIFFALQIPPSPWMVLAFWFLLARLMISSGLVKLFSKDPTWRELTAVKYHYETQPLPNTFAFFLHKLPKRFHQLSTLVMFTSELVIPALIFMPSPVRLIAFFALAGLQIILMFTGNYAFLNLLTFTICLPLLNNDQLNFLPVIVGDNANSLALTIASAAGIFYCGLNVLHLVRFAYPHQLVLKTLYPLFRYHITGSYGLFAIMTTRRRELVIQGSDDGNEWKTYEFRFKPGTQRPRQIAPFHPRLDWQMWFAALRPDAFEAWRHNLIERLLSGSKDVAKLFKINPFPKNPPKMIRIVVYDYHFNDWATWRKTGQWWQRSMLTQYPALEIKTQANN